MKKITRTIGEYTYDWYSQSELLDMFSEIIPEEIAKCEKTIAELEAKISELINYLNNCNTDKFTIWFCKEIIKMELVAKLLEQERYLRLLKSKLPSPKNDWHRQREIDYAQRKEKAKSFPIEEIAGRYMELKKSGDKYSALCPYHSERKASFFLYPNGTFHCFGCGKSGDVIQLTQDLCGTDFLGAIEILQH